jgi:hypothetical protein
MAIVQTEALIRSDEKGKIRKRIEAVINDPMLLNLHSINCNKNLMAVSIEWDCDCDVLEFLRAVLAE